MGEERLAQMVSVLPTSAFVTMAVTLFLGVFIAPVDVMLYRPPDACSCIASTCCVSVHAGVHLFWRASVERRTFAASDTREAS